MTGIGRFLPDRFWDKGTIYLSFPPSLEQRARLKPLLPSKMRGVPRADDRRVVSGIVDVLQSGCRLAHEAPRSDRAKGT